jgi:transmembrane sensor
MVNTVQWELLDRYYGGQCSPAEVEAIECWAARSDANRVRLDSGRRVWEMTGVIPEWFDAERGWEAIAAQLAPRPRVIALREWQRARPARRTRPVLLGVAAAALLAATALGGWRWMRALVAHRDAPTLVAAREYVTARGQRGTIVLVDGTRVWLNVDSRLRAGTGYGASARDVYLDGEAVFAVEHDQARPFRVHTATGVAEDVGTEFVVQAYPEDSSTSVAVADGVVELRAAARPADRAVTLGRGQLGRVDRSAYLTVEQDVDIDRWLAWRDGRLQFREMPLADVARELERWYGVRIELPDSELGQVPITATFMNQTVEDVMGVIARSIGGRYTRSGPLIRLFVPAAGREVR